jgi:deoxycytidylate deaminase
LTLLTVGTATAQTARVQVIHNCADAAADSVDVYLDGNLLLDNFAFRTATPFVDLPANTPIRIGIAPKTSSSEMDTVYSVTTTLSSTNTYIAVAEGIVSSSGYNPAPDFGLNVYNMGQEVATTTGNTDILVLHGATDAPTVDVKAGMSTLVDDLSYGQYASGYLNLPTADYVIDVTDGSGMSNVRSYSAPLQTLNLQDEAIVVLASGFLNSPENSYGHPFGLYAALASGGHLVPLPPINSARVQVIHNCADAVADSVDVYINGALALDNFAFRTATPFLTLPADSGAVNIAIAPKTSTSVNDAIYTTSATLSSANTYVIVAEGIVSSTGYSPAPAFGLNVYASGRETAENTDNTDVLVVHGATDAPVVDVRAGMMVLVDDITYGTINSGYLELPTNDYVIDITNAAGTTTVESYSAPLASLNLHRAALTVLASGFLDPSMNSNGPAFGLYAALPSGGELIPLPVATSVKNISVKNNILKVYPNPATDMITIENAGVAALHTVTDVTGRVLISGNGSNVNIAHLAPGMYVINITDKGNRYHSQFIKK